MKRKRLDLLKLCPRAGEFRDNRTDWNLFTRDARMAAFSIKRMTTTLVEELRRNEPLFFSEAKWQEAMSRGYWNK